MCSTFLVLPSVAGGVSLKEERAANNPAVAALPIRKSLREKSRLPIRVSKTLNTVTSQALARLCFRETESSRRHERG
jgi:hypothetical protein